MEEKERGGSARKGREGRKVQAPLDQFLRTQLQCTNVVSAENHLLVLGFGVFGRMNYQIVVISTFIV